ncbi:M20/M25/M40 family metallo-hydrolase [Streptacidiphilus sp. 4-A2]|nr:M20/M25/M40 family metallo-hydrolase [Streptacidiphilus sp. 4-A2]
MTAGSARPPSTPPSGWPRPGCRRWCWSRAGPGQCGGADRRQRARPAALLVHGHLDVVPAQAEDWSVPPFSGEIRDGVVWGRGAVDMKGMDAMMLAVVRAWSREGRGPRRDVVLCFTADEEDSAAAGADWLVRNHAGLFEGCTEAVGESGGYTVHTAAGQRLYPVGGERGTGWMELTAAARPGTAPSQPRQRGDQAVRGDDPDRRAPLAGADHPTVRAALLALGAATGVPLSPAEVDDPAFDADGYLAGWTRRRPRWCWRPFRNSANPTVLRAGYKTNVIPGLAVGEVDGRTLPELSAEFEATMDQLTGPDVEWSYLHRETALTAPVDTPLFAAVRDALLAHDPGAAVVPFCMSGGTDAKQFSRLGIAGYGFSPLRLPPGYDFQGLFHGVDERVPAEALRFGAAVLDDFLSSVG